MTTDPKPYLDYLDKEMTIMGLLSAFSLAWAAFAIEKIATANTDFLRGLWTTGQAHVIAGAAAAVVASIAFYLQRSLLAWYFGQIALAQSRGDDASPTAGDWLEWADGWDTWVSYQTGCITIVVSIACYAYAVAELFAPSLASLPRFWSLWLPLIAVFVVIVVRRHVLRKRSQDEDPFDAWRPSFWKRSPRTPASRRESR